MTIRELNNLNIEEFKTEILKCCGSLSWADNLSLHRPFNGLNSILREAEKAWNDLSENDWKEAFTHHPKIGGINSSGKKFGRTKKWAAKEQSGINSADEAKLEQLAVKNKLYEKKFGYIFIICAAGKSAEEMLKSLTERLSNKPSDEIKIAACEQLKITRLRLKKLLA